METLPLLHIGYVKTGSTWLQDTYFDVDSSPFLSLASQEELGSQIVLPHCLEPLADDFVQKIKQKMGQAYKKGKVPVLTGERLSGNPICGGHDTLLIAERLKELFGDARILIVVREQSDMILSCYKQYIRECGVGSLNKYVNPPNDAKLPMFDISFFHYHRLVQKYQELFGRDRVKVLCYEQFREDPLGFCNEIAEYAGVDKATSISSSEINTALRNSTILARSYTNWLFCRTRVNAHAPFNIKWISQMLNGASKYVPGFIEKRLGYRMRRKAQEIAKGQFAESNKKLEKIAGVKLSGYGYDS